MGNAKKKPSNNEKVVSIKKGKTPSPKLSVQPATLPKKKSSTTKKADKKETKLSAEDRKTIREKETERMQKAVDKVLDRFGGVTDNYKSFYMDPNCVYSASEIGTRMQKISEYLRANGVARWGVTKDDKPKVIGFDAKEGDKINQKCLNAAFSLYRNIKLMFWTTDFSLYTGTTYKSILQGKFGVEFDD